MKDTTVVTADQYLLLHQSVGTENIGTLDIKTMFTFSLTSILACAFLFSSDIEVSALTIQQQQQQQEQSDAPPLTPDEIAFLDSLEHLENDDVEAAYAVLEASFTSSARNPDPEKRFHRLSQRKISLGGGTTFTSEYKIRQDIEQAQYLAETLKNEDMQNHVIY